MVRRQEGCVDLYALVKKAYGTLEGSDMVDGISIASMISVVLTAGSTGQQIAQDILCAAMWQIVSRYMKT